MKRLRQEGISYYITSKAPFIDNSGLQTQDIQKSFDYAWDMSFGQKGEHRHTRSGGTHERTLMERFIDAFNGKVAEFGVYRYLQQFYNEVSPPDCSVYELGKWDDVDIVANKIKYSVKATKEYGNLMLLEKDDWDENGRFKPDINRTGGVFDRFIFARYSPDASKVLRTDRTLRYVDKISRTELENIILSCDWKVNVVGFATREMLSYVIKSHQIIPKYALLNGKSRMDATNYYIQSGDLIQFDKTII